MLTLHLIGSIFFGVVLPRVAQVNKLKVFFYTISCLLIIKSLLFLSSNSWDYHLNLIDELELRGREKQTISLLSKSKKKNNKVKYLPFGNSQIGFLFNKRMISDRSDYEAVSIPGLRLIEYNYFVDDLIKLNPEVVILYLSDKTIAANPDVYPLGVRPVNLSQLWQSYFKLKVSSITPKFSDYIEISLGELIYPFKYGFLFKSYRDHYFLKMGSREFLNFSEESDNDDMDGTLSFNHHSDKGHEVLLSQFTKARKISNAGQIKSSIPIAQNNEQKKKPEAINGRKNKKNNNYDKKLRFLIKRKLNEFNETNVDFNMEELKLFADKISANGIKLVIIEGHYHPDAYNTRAELTELVSSRLEEFARVRNDVAYIPRSDLPSLMKNHYKDETHLNPRPSDKMFVAIDSQLNKINFGR